MNAAWIFLAIIALPTLYAIHRLCLWLEQRGFLYYRDKQPPSGGVSPFIGLQEFIQPNIREMIEAEDHSTEKAGEDRYVPGLPRPKRWDPTQLPPEPEEPKVK